MKYIDSYNYIDYCWNGLLFIIIFPYLLIIKKSVLFSIVIYIIILSHIYILYIKLKYNTLVHWSIYCEIISIVFGAIFIYEGSYIHKNYLIILFGILIIYGHIRKIIYPELPYYI